MRKKLLVTILTVVLAASALTGCKKQITAKQESDLKWDSSSQSYTMEKGAKLTFWADNDDFGKKIVELWSKKYPDVQLTYQKVGATDVANKLKLDGPAGLGGDVVFMPHNSVVDLREAGVLFKMPEQEKKMVKDLVQEPAYNVAVYKDDLYAIPSSVENIALVYNKQILKVLPAIKTARGTTAANLLEQIEGKQIYMEELLKGVADWGNSYKGAGIEVPFAKDRFYKGDGDKVSASEDKHTILAWQLYDAYHNYFLLTRDGYKVFGENSDDATKFSIDSDKVTSSIQAVTGDWYGNKSGSKLFPGLATIKDMAWDQSAGRLQKGQVAMTMTGPWVMGDLKANWKTWVEKGQFGITANTKVDDVFGATELPKFSNDVHPTTFSGVQVTAMNVYTSYPNASMNLMRFLCSDEMMKEVYGTLGKIPAVKDSSKIPGLSEDKMSNGFLEQAKYSHAMPVIQEGNYMWDPLRDVWTNIFDEKMSIKDSQAKSAVDYQNKLKDAGSKTAK